MGDQLAPGFLIAFPHLNDPNFRQSVVLLLRQDESGAMGVVLNRESPMLVSDLCRDQSIDYSGDGAKKIREGGPCQPEQGLVLYGAECEDPEGQAVVGDLCVSASRSTLSRLCDSRQGRFQCFSGYAGWGPGQLEKEIREGTWITSEADPGIALNTPPRDMWDAALRAMGLDASALVAGGGGEA